MTAEANRQTLQRQIRSQFKGNRKIPFVATDHEISHGRDITLSLRAREAPEHISETWIGTSWIVEARTTGTRDGMPFWATHLFLTSLHTTAEAEVQVVHERWNIKGRHWIRDTQLQEDPHGYRGNGAGAVATLRTAALNLLRLSGLQSIRAGMQAVMHDITALLGTTRRQPDTNHDEILNQPCLGSREEIDQADRGVVNVTHVAGRQLRLPSQGNPSDQVVAQIDVATHYPANPWLQRHSLRCRSVHVGDTLLEELIQQLCRLNRPQLSYAFKPH